MTKNKAIVVAHYFMKKSNEDKRTDFTNKKIQKLLYYSQAWSLVLNEKKLFNDKFEAWIHGPAIPSVYRHFKPFGFANVSEDFDEGELQVLTADEQKLLDEIWKIYGKYDADYLELLTHSEKPWQNARQHLDPFTSSNTEISEGEMKRFYGEKLKETQSRA